MRSMRVLAVTIAAVGVMVMAGCGSVAHTGTGQEIAATTSQKPAASQKQTANSKSTQPSAARLGHAGKLPKGMKPVTTQTVPPKIFPLQYWLEPLGVVNGEYRIVVHLWAIKPVSKFKLDFSVDPAKKLTPHMVDGPSDLHAVDGVATFRDFDYGALQAGQGMDLTVAYPASLAHMGSIAVTAWAPGAVANGRVLAPSNGTNL